MHAILIKCIFYTGASLLSASNSNPVRLAEIKCILAHIEHHVPTIFLGDFNENEHAPGSCNFLFFEK